MFAEYRKPSMEAAARPTTPHRFGPTPLRPPWSGVWQARHWLNTRWPAAASPDWADARPGAKATAATAIVIIIRRMRNSLP
jgi:hypothetical protein